jgi:signal transduction histidine kinase
VADIRNTGSALQRVHSEPVHPDAEPFSKSNQALQATIDILGENQDLDQLVPRVLQILADTFGAETCSFFRNYPSGETRLWYWYTGGRTLLPDQLMLLDPQNFATIHLLAQGFEVPDAYLGRPASRVIGACVLDHVAGTAVPDFDRFALSYGWELELNIGVAARGVRAFSLCIFRKRTHPYSDQEIRLAEALAKQLGLAVEISRLADEARAAAVAEERAVAAEKRAAELAKANEAMQATTNALATLSDLHHFVPAALRVAARAFGSDQALFYVHPATAPIQLRYWLRGNEVLTAQEILTLEVEGMAVVRILVEGFEVPDRHLGTPVRKRTRAMVLDHRQGSAVEAFDAFCRNNGMDLELNVPLVVGEIAEGAMLFFRRTNEPFTEGEIALAEALGKQIALAMQASKVAESAKSAALAKERDEAAQRRAVDLASVNSVLTSSVARLSEASDMREFLAHVFAEIIRITGATNACATRYDRETNQLQLELFHDGATPRWGLSADELALWAAPYDADITPAFGIGLKHRQIFVASMLQQQTDVRLEHFALPGGAEWMAAKGCSDAAVSVLFAGDQPVGTFHLHFTAGRTLRPEDLPLLNSLSQQAAIGLRLVTLSDQANAAALMREREAIARLRAAELSKANDAMRQAIESLAIEPDLLSFGGRLLAIIGQQFGAPVVEYWVNDNPNVAKLKLTCRDGQLYTGSDMENDPRVSGIAIPSKMTGAQDLYAPRAYFLSDDLPNDPVQQAVYTPLGLNLASWCKSRNVGKHLNVPLRSGGETFGALVIYIPADQHFSDVRIELAYALAHQMTLAIRLTDLALESQRATIAKEREKAALEKAAGLARANEALKLSLGTMSTGKSGAALLEGMLAVLRDSMNAVSVALRIRDPRVLAAIADDRYALEPCGTFPGFAAHIAARQPLFLLVSEDETLPDEARVALISQGVRSQLAIPMLLGEELVGALMIRLSSDQRPANEQWELARALSHQATLAIRLTQLAAEARQEARAKAVSDERAAIARELHDTLLQSFTGVMLQLRALGLRAMPDEAARAEVSAIERQATEAVYEARQAVGVMRGRPEVDLPSDLRRFIESIRATTGLAADFAQEGTSWNVPPSVAGGLLRVAQEALRNAARHSGSTRVRIGLSYGAGSVQVMVSDNGCGFDLAQAQARPGHFGISGMRERAQEIGAVLEILSAPGQGTCVQIRYLSGSSSAFEKSGSETIS